MMLRSDVHGYCHQWYWHHEYCHHLYCHHEYWNLHMTFTMLRSDVPSHGIQKPTPHTSLQHNVPTVAAAEVVKVVKAVAVVKPLYDVPTYSSKSILLFTTSWENPEVVLASERGRQYHLCSLWWRWQWRWQWWWGWYVWDRRTQGEDIASV